MLVHRSSSLPNTAQASSVKPAVPTAATTKNWVAGALSLSGLVSGLSEWIPRSVSHRLAVQTGVFLATALTAQLALSFGAPALAEGALVFRPPSQDCVGDCIVQLKPPADNSVESLISEELPGRLKDLEAVALKPSIFLDEGDRSALHENVEKATVLLILSQKVGSPELSKKMQLASFALIAEHYRLPRAIQALGKEMPQLIRRMVELDDASAREKLDPGQELRLSLAKFQLQQATRGLAESLNANPDVEAEVVSKAIKSSELEVVLEDVLSADKDARSGPPSWLLSVLGLGALGVGGVAGFGWKSYQVRPKANNDTPNQS
jgi:hypothetical protein